MEAKPSFVTSILELLPFNFRALSAAPSKNWQRSFMETKDSNFTKSKLWSSKDKDQRISVPGFGKTRHLPPPQVDLCSSSLRDFGVA